MNQPFRLTRMSSSSWFKLTYRHIVVHFDPGYGGKFENQLFQIEEMNEKATLILISHGHLDHVRPEVLARIAGPATAIICPEVALDSVPHPTQIVKPGDKLTIGQLEIEVIDAYNTTAGHSTKKFHVKGVGVGYILTIGGRRIYHAGDTDVIPEMRRAYGVDIAMIPVGGTYVLDAEEAVQAYAVIKPRLFIPMHEGADPLKAREFIKAHVSSGNIVFLDSGSSHEFE